MVKIADFTSHQGEHYMRRAAAVATAATAVAVVVAAPESPINSAAVLAEAAEDRTVTSTPLAFNSLASSSFSRTVVHAAPSATSVPSRVSFMAVPKAACDSGSIAATAFWMSSTFAFEKSTPAKKVSVADFAKSVESSAVAARTSTG